MKFIGQLILVLFVTAGMAGVVSAGAKDKKDHGAAVAGTYDGKAYIEIMQRELPLKLELKRIHRDSVIVEVTDFVLPTGQKFSYRSAGVSVKPEVKDGKTVYKLNISFTYNYNSMPMRVTATGTITDGELNSTVKAVIMDAMETKVTYKAKCTTK
ncbi:MULTISPECIES: hypothetical protein [Butyricimonas]|uniref:Uncharacterized protein n=1 Tax=Butyricimonas hominis TaxID=2763032 RepID=A0ABR7D4J4_9BACT|nr:MULTISPECIES: hypothetical protein [Butyricimonas]MBC5622799.1 hypothetical protein [Butyricimonas hominis]MCB6971591.1 hypothetical protein [Butyricimonas synergistica]MCG4518801.1 hypothetical protein [Butyricimonas sp. DFI.6.44]